MSDTEPTGPVYPTLVLQILAQHPTIRLTTDPGTLIGKILTLGGQHG